MEQSLAFSELTLSGKSPSPDLSMAVVSYWRKYVHLVLVNRLGVESLSRNSDHAVMTIAVYHRCKATKQQ